MRAITTHLIGDHNKLGKPSITFGLQRCQLLFRRGAAGRQLCQFLLKFLGIFLPSCTLNAKGARQLGVASVGLVELVLQPSYLGALLLQLSLASHQLGLGLLLQKAVLGLKGLLLGEQPVEDLGPKLVAVLKRRDRC